jgi:signal transduction histidine kinase
MLPTQEGAPTDREVLSLAFLDEVTQEVLDSWGEDAFLDREAAAREFEAMAEWIHRGAPEEEGPAFASDRLLTRRLAELLTRAVISHWDEAEPGNDRAFMQVLSALRRLPVGGAALDESFETRLSDPDGFELVAQLGHDLRSPLTSITFLAETLRDGFSGPVTDHQNHQLGLIYSAALGLSSVVTDVVDLAKAGGDPLDGEPQAFSLHAILESVRRVVQPLADIKEIEFRWSLNTHDRVMGHQLAVTRVLMNLVINGLKFTEEGYVEITVSSVARGLVEFSVRDTGRGIPDDNQKRLFEPFRKSSVRRGSFFSTSGLGLTIVRRLLLAMGSELQLETRPDWGTRFYFRLRLPPQTSF